jgi:AcrR family transcriptional regulator
LSVIVLSIRLYYNQGSGIEKIKRPRKRSVTNYKVNFVSKGDIILDGGITDRRVQKTIKLLQDALIDLICEKGYEAVTIQELLDRANVGRSTFYMHFDNKDELLHSCFEGFRHLLEKQQSAITNNSDENILALFRFAEKNHRLLKSYMKHDGTLLFDNHLYNFVCSFISSDPRHAARSNRQQVLVSEMHKHYTASAVLGVLKWWISNDMPIGVDGVVSFLRDKGLFPEQSS